MILRITQLSRNASGNSVDATFEYAGRTYRIEYPGGNDLSDPRWTWYEKLVSETLAARALLVILDRALKGEVLQLPYEIDDEPIHRRAEDAWKYGRMDIRPLEDE